MRHVGTSHHNLEPVSAAGRARYRDCAVDAQAPAFVAVLHPHGANFRATARPTKRSRSPQGSRSRFVLITPFVKYVFSL